MRCHKKFREILKNLLPVTLQESPEYPGRHELSEKVKVTTTPFFFILDHSSYFWPWQQRRWALAEAKEIRNNPNSTDRQADVK